MKIVLPFGLNVTGFVSGSPNYHIIVTKPHSQHKYILLYVLFELYSGIGFIKQCRIIGERSNLTIKWLNKSLHKWFIYTKKSSPESTEPWFTPWSRHSWPLFTSPTLGTCNRFLKPIRSISVTFRTICETSLLLSHYRLSLAVRYGSFDCFNYVDKQFRSKFSISWNTTNHSWVVCYYTTSKPELIFVATLFSAQIFFQPSFYLLGYKNLVFIIK